MLTDSYNTCNLYHRELTQVHIDLIICFTSSTFRLFIYLCKEYLSSVQIFKFLIIVIIPSQIVCVFTKKTTFFSFLLEVLSFNTEIIV